MTTAIVVGMQTERNIVGDRPGDVVIVGAGNAIKLAAIVSAAIDDGCDHVLSFGTCGALSPALAAGALVVGALMTDPPAPGVFCDAAWARRIWQRTGAEPVSVTLAAATIATAAAKVALYASTKADVVDMESCIAATIAKKRGVPFAMLRAVSDAADQDIPPAALAALSASGGVDLWSVVDSLAEDDDQLPELLRLAGSSKLAFDALTKALMDLGLNYGESD